MNPTPYPFKDFLQTKHQLQRALLEHREPFALLSGDTGTGKTALLRALRTDIDRSRHRLLYFAQASQLTPAGLIKVIAEILRVPTSLCHALSFERILHVLAEDPRTLLLWFDEAHELPESTLCQARTLCESNLQGPDAIQILLIGLPKLRAQLHKVHNAATSPSVPTALRSIPRHPHVRYSRRASSASAVPAPAITIASLSVAPSTPSAQSPKLSAPAPSVTCVANAPRRCASICSPIPNPFACSSPILPRKTFSSTKPSCTTGASSSTRSSTASP